MDLSNSDDPTHFDYRPSSRASSYCSVDSGASHPPRAGNIGKKAVDMSFTEFAELMANNPTEDYTMKHCPSDPGHWTDKSTSGYESQDDIVDSLLSHIDPRDDRMYYCEDLHCEDHSCGFFHKRRHMLRCVGFLLFSASCPCANHICIV